MHEIMHWEILRILGPGYLQSVGTNALQGKEPLVEDVRLVWTVAASHIHAVRILSSLSVV